MKKIFIPFVLFLLILALGTSCRGSKEVAYWQNIDTVHLAGERALHDAKIMPKDELTISVSTLNPEASAMFNISPSGSINTTANNSGSSTNMYKYLVDNNGTINFPVIGRIHVVGLSKSECEDLITSKIRPYLSATENPIVTVRMSSFRIVVLGEVNSPGVKPVATEKISIVEALASAGDMTIYGQRKNILLIRENADGSKTQVRFNMNDANLFNSPYYYLQQNDIVYVEPSNVKKKGAELGPSTSLWFSFISIATSLASLLVNVLRN